MMYHLLLTVIACVAVVAGSAWAQDDGTVYYFNADWSPDGTKIAFASGVDGGLSIYTIGLDGNDLTRLTDDQYNDEGPYIVWFSAMYPILLLTAMGFFCGSILWTRHLPLSARNSPRRMRINVVLPCPFVPSKPKIEPLGISRLTPPKTRLLPKCLWRSSMTMLGESDMMNYPFLQNVDLAIEQFM